MTELLIPGYAVLCRVRFAQATPQGAGYRCAFAVPAKNVTEAGNKACEQISDGTAEVEDIRPLSAAEASGLVGIRLLGGRVFFDSETL